MKRAVVAGMVWVLCGAPGLALAQAPSAVVAGDKEQAFPASALLPEREGVVSISALLGYGFALDTGSRVVDDYGVGAGVRAGYTFAATPLYLGGTGLGYRPEDDTEDVQLYSLDFELGYEVSAGPVVLRPYLGLGAYLVIFDLTERSEPGARAGSGISLQLVPGFLASYSLGPLRVGAEARYSRVSVGKDALVLLGSAGVAF
jgi:hypothetical protein